MSERTIHILPEQVASQIAAGEVVERPASALKELLENALDAGARNITVELERGGAGLIAVSDDGCGMGREDAHLALRRHATSKIRDAADLNSVRTMGFRGEALASISSVARLRLATRPANRDRGCELSVIGGELESIADCAMAPGTRIEVRDLFFNTPARLKFLKTVATEQTAAIEAVQRLALAHYRAAFLLKVDNRVVLEAPRASSTLERVRQIYGSRLADRLLPFSAASDGMKVSGLTSTSHESFGSARLIFTYVDQRWVSDRALLRAIIQAYQSLLPRGRYPAAVLYLELPRGDVDVNVHPMKTEVRFRRSGAVFELVYHVLRARLADQSVEPGAKAAETELGPGRAEHAPAPAPSAGRPPDSAAGLQRSALGDQPEPRLRLVAEGGAALPAQRGETFATGAAAAPRYSELRVVGQLFAGYIALEGAGGMLLIDQHAAHERVTFERLRQQARTGAVQVQAMLTPELIELSPALAARAGSSLDAMRALGFEVEMFGPASLRVSGAPAVFGTESGAKLLADLIGAMGEHGFDLSGADAFDDCLKTLACHGSIRVGRVLRGAEIAQLLTDLDATEFKTNCPHGRPVHIELGRGAIERMFRR